MSDTNLAKVTAAAIERQEAHIADLQATKATSRNFSDAQKVLAQLINQGRALAKDGKRWADKLTPEQQREEIVGWFEALPPQQQKLFAQAIMRVMNERAA